MASIDFSKLKTSWTKYDIVQVMDVISSEEKIEKYKNKEIDIDEPILRSFLGIKRLIDPIPPYWIELQNYPNEKRLFAMFAVIFTHGDVIWEFANEYSTGDMQGLFTMQPGKQYTNIRSALVESGASAPSHRRADEVPFDFSSIFKNGNVGILFKQLLTERIERVSRKKLNPADFYPICFENDFHYAISISRAQFEAWTSGEAINQVLSKEQKRFNLEESFSLLNKFTRSLLEKEGWDIAFELVEQVRHKYLLKLKEKYAHFLSLLIDNKEKGVFEIPSFIELYNQLRLADPTTTTKNLSIDSATLDSYIDKIRNDLNSIQRQYPEFKTLIELILQSNICHIDTVKIKNFYSVSEANLSHINGAKETYFLGENGDGKSLMLMGIYLAFNRYFIANKTEQDETGKVIDIIKGNPDLELLATDVNGEHYGNDKGKYLSNFLAYGTHRGRYNSISGKAEEYGFMSLFDCDKVLNDPVQWLKNQKLLELEKVLDSKNFIAEKKYLPNSFPIDALQDMFYELLEKNVQIDVDGNGVYFTEKGHKLTFEQLSEGYKSILIFVSDMIYRLSQVHEDGTKLADLKGVVLVDEIDLHLHIKWQRVIVGKLRTLFPNVQFIFTTHSPAMIQGASDDAVIYRVYRNADDGKTRLSDPYYRKDLNHLMINTLVTSTLFGLENSRLDPEDNNSDTSETYLLYRINNKLEETLAKQKQEGKTFVSDEEIDDLIQQIIDEELGKKND